VVDQGGSGIGEQLMDPRRAESETIGDLANRPAVVLGRDNGPESLYLRSIRCTAQSAVESLALRSALALLALSTARLPVPFRKLNAKTVLSVLLLPDPRVRGVGGAKELSRNGGSFLAATLYRSVRACVRSGVRG